MEIQDGNLKNKNKDIYKEGNNQKNKKMLYHKILKEIKIIK